MKTMYTKNASSLKKAAENFITYLDTLYYEEKKMDGLWEKANEVSEVGYKVHSASMSVELVAERISDNSESGALWAAAEILQHYSDKLDHLAAEIMSINRQSETIEPKKKKKKDDLDGRC